MKTEIFESEEQLELIEAEALESMDEVTPLENNTESVEIPEEVNEPDMEMSICTCSGGCGSNYSTGDCICSGNCGSNHHK